MADTDELWDLSGRGTLPPDVYDHPEWYGWGEFTAGCAVVIRAVRGRPDELVTIYRAVPPGVAWIAEGDWVAIVEGYARQHAMQDDDPAHDWPVISARVPARMVRSGSGDIIEWGYWGPEVLGQVVP
jgi:hypothetical protein